jgi:NADPH2:quinone reductase
MSSGTAMRNLDRPAGIGGEATGQSHGHRTPDRPDWPDSPDSPDSPDGHRVVLERQLERHRSDLTTHCWHLLGSTADADDAVQETMVRAWRSLGSFQQRCTLRTWLYRIATNVCLDLRRRQDGRALPVGLAAPDGRSGYRGPTTIDANQVFPPPGAAARLAAGDPGEAAVAREDVRLAFVELLRRLPTRQRTVVVLCDVLRWPSAEAAELLGTSLASVTSARQRARAALAASASGASGATAAAHRDLDRCLDAFQRHDVESLVTLLSHSMPGAAWADHERHGDSRDGDSPDLIGRQSMRAVVVDPSAPLGCDFADVAEPSVSDDQVLVAVAHASLNRGDLNDAKSGRLAPGAVLGSDVAGVVVQAAADGSGPPVDTRVVALAAGAFAERCAVAVTALAPVPPSVDLADAAALPVAGLAALQALRAAGLDRGKRVLVTGASGGVGRFAVQIAAHADAHVIASVGSPARGEGLADAGANQVVVGLDDIDEPVDIVLDNVGGPTLAAAWDLLAPGGSLQSIGWSSGEPAVLRPYATVGPAKSLTSFLIGGHLTDDLATLVALLDAGHLTVDIGWRGPWTDIGTAAAAMLDRTLRGKAALDIG